MFDIAIAYYSRLIISASMVIVAILVAIGAWRRRLFPLYLSMPLVVALLVLFRPWGLIRAFEDPGELPPWDDDTHAILAIYKSIFVAFVLFLPVYLASTIATFRSILKERSAPPIDTDQDFDSVEIKRVLLHTFLSRAEAESCVQYLASHSISAVLFSDDAARWAPHFGFATGFAVYVAASDADLAAAAISEYSTDR